MSSESTPKLRAGFDVLSDRTTLQALRCDAIRCTVAQRSEIDCATKCLFSARRSTAKDDSIGDRCLL
jgi:hypothetical protein